MSEQPNNNETKLEHIAATITTKGGAVEQLEVATVITSLLNIQDALKELKDQTNKVLTVHVEEARRQKMVSGEGDAGDKMKKEEVKDSLESSGEEEI